MTVRHAILVGKKARECAVSEVLVKAPWELCAGLHPQLKMRLPTIHNTLYCVVVNYLTDFIGI